jgi:hypothetical protein
MSSIRQYYSEILSRGQRTVPTYSEARKDLEAALKEQYSVYGRI